MKDKLSKRFQSARNSHLWGFFLAIVVAIVLIAIFQDFLHSKRVGGAFYFSESLLFKSLWFVFPPLLLLLKDVIQSRGKFTALDLSIAAIIFSVIHVLLVPAIVWSLSTIFREQSYGYYKVLSFTLANDLVKVLIIYGAFAVFLRYANNVAEKTDSKAQVPSIQYLTVSSGRNKSRIALDDILYIKSATPYISIQLKDKEYLHSDSLKSISEKLDPRFIRVHRSSIVNLDKVVSYKSRLNGDYDLVLQYGAEVRLSRNYVSEFKERFQTSPQLKV